MNQEKSSQPLRPILFPKHTVLCRQADKNTDLFIIQSGEVLICLLKESQVIPVNVLKAGEYFGEFSFFDNLPRSAYALTLSESNILRVSQDSLDNQMQPWLFMMAKQLTSKVRQLDDVLKSRGIKKKSDHSMAPFSIDEQRFYFQLLTTK